MSKPSRSSEPTAASFSPRTFFVTTRTASSKSLFQTARMAELLIDVFRGHMRHGKITAHHFVVMPDHFHILTTVPGGMSIEKAMQLIKGGFSFRAKKELGFRGEIWQRGYSDVQILNDASFQRHRNYIDNNPIRTGLVGSAEEYPFGTAYLKKQKQGLKPADLIACDDGTTNVVP